MVWDSVWRDEAGMSEGFLCIGCLEHRIGRQLTSEDFTFAAINEWPEDPWHTPRLAEALTRKPYDQHPEDVAAFVVEHYRDLVTSLL